MTFSKNFGIIGFTWQKVIARKTTHLIELIARVLFGHLNLEKRTQQKFHDKHGLHCS